MPACAPFCPGGVLMSPHHGGIHTDRPVHLANSIRLPLHLSQDPIPGPVTNPTVEAMLHSSATGRTAPADPATGNWRDL